MDERTRLSAGVELEQIARLLSLADHALTRRLTMLLDQERSSVDQWRTLTLLGDGRSRSMSELAEFALLPAASLTRLVDRMVADNLVYRKADPQDRRRVLVRITSRGRELERRLHAQMSSDSALAELASAHGEQLSDLLRAFIARLSEP